MRSKRPVLTVEEQQLFDQAMAGIEPLRGRDRVKIPPPPPSVVRVIELPAEVKLAVEAEGDRYSARAPGVSRAQLTEMRKLHASATLDLHGETVERGCARLREFVVQAAPLHRCVLVIHGKGLHSEHGAPLREAVVAELLGPLSGLVRAFATAAPADGGEGATRVLLRGGK